MSPLAIITLLEIHCLTDEATVNREGVRQCERAGLIRMKEQFEPRRDLREGNSVRNIFETTDKGRAMVVFLTEMPLPERKTTWSLPAEHRTEVTL